MTNPNIEPRLTQAESRLDRIEEIQEENARSISELRSTVATLADLITIQQQEAEAEREQARADRALMLQLIQAIAQGRNGEG